MESFDDADDPIICSRGRSIENDHPSRLQYAEMVDKAQDGEAVENLLTLLETLELSTLEVALPSLCQLAEKCESVGQKKRVQTLAKETLHNEESTRGSRKAAIAALKVVRDGPQWNDFFLLVEALEEPQFHIVRPVLARFDSLMSPLSPSSTLSIEWIWLVVRRASLHTNGWIRLWALQKAVSFPSEMLLTDSKPLTTLILPQLNSVDMFWRIIERNELENFMKQMSEQVTELLEKMEDREKAVCQLVDILESVESTTCPYTYYFLSLMLRKISIRPLLTEEHLPLCKRIIARFHYVPYLILKNETTANFVFFMVKVIYWSSSSILSSLSYFIRLLSSSTDGASSRRLSSLSNTLSLVWSQQNTPFDPKMDSWINALEENYEEEDLGWLLWERAAHSDVRTQFETELEKSIVENICDEGNQSIVDRLLGIWVRRRSSDGNDVAESFVTIITEYMTMRLFTMQGTVFDRSLCSNVFCPLIDKCGQLANVLSECILEFLKQDVSTERQGVLLLLLKECLGKIPKEKVPIESLKEYLGESPLDGKLPKKSIDELSTRDFQHISESVHAARTRLFRTYFLDKDGAKDWEKMAEEAIEIVDYAALYERKAELLSIVEVAMDKIRCPNLLMRVVNSSNGVVSEERKSLNSLPSLAQAMRITLHKNVLSWEETVDRAQELFTYYLTQSSLSLSVSLVLAQSLSDAQDHLDEKWAKQVMKLAIFGPVPKKDGKVLTSAYEMIYGKDERVDGESVLDRIHETVQRARMIATCVAVRVCDRCPQFASQLSKELLEECAELDKSGNKSFGLSFPHRAKTRAVALLLLIVDYVKDEDSIRECFERSVTFVYDPCQQFSIKLLVEWVMVRLAIKEDQYWEKLVGIEEELANMRIGSVTSWLNMLVHVARVKKEQTPILCRVLELVVPWCTAQNFAVRCTAIASCHLLYELLPENVQKQYSLVKGIISFESEPAGNSRRIIDSLCADFYFARLHAVYHFDMQTVLSTVAERTGMPPDERIPDSLIVELNNTTIRSFNNDFLLLDAPSLVYNSLSKCNSSAPEMVVPEDSLNVVDNEDDASPVEEGSLQRKIVTGGTSRPKDCSMIVVASLVDKPANLGGLCRTSEIFGVDCLVVADMQLTKDVSFKALSMSSECWQKMEGVRPENLVEYLTQLRSEGYTVIAAEQTTDSQPMHHFQFPKKCVLVVGDEREGVPTRLLRCVDQTVEISQLGQTRSLNVHVTAALFIAKYAEQRLIGKE